LRQSKVWGRGLTEPLPYAKVKILTNNFTGGKMKKPNNENQINQEQEADQELDNFYGWKAVRKATDKLIDLRKEYKQYKDQGKKQQFHEVLDYIIENLDNLFELGLDDKGLDIHTLVEEELVELNAYEKISSDPSPISPIVETDDQYNNRVLDNIISFLQENEQYGDDWDSEINVLNNLKKS